MKYFFSFDDGHPHDLKIGEWLIKNNCEAIFYIPLKNSEGLPVVTPGQIKELSKSFEIGAHTYNHVDLTTVSLETASGEIAEGKKALEDIIGKSITSFAPPRGHYNHQIINICRSLGFKTFRSARLFNINPSDRNAYIWHPNIHLYPHSLPIDLFHSIKQNDLNSFLFRFKHLNLSHLELIKTIKEPRELHLWGHSWELLNYNLNLDSIVYGH